MKAHKTISKRVKVTKTGKIMKRKAGQNHFNSRESSNTTRNKRRDISVSTSYDRNIKQLI